MKYELYNDHFENAKRYQIPRAQLIIADIPYNLGNNAYASDKQIEMIAKTYDVNPAWLVGWVDDEMQPTIQVVEKIIYKESPTARLPDYHNNNNDGKIIKWIKSKKYMGGKVWSKRT
nr:MAG TPA: hypothetical protein [Caudoviricetes sp.]